MTRKVASILVSSLLLLLNATRSQAQPVPTGASGKRPFPYDDEQVS